MKKTFFCLLFVFSFLIAACASQTDGPKTPRRFSLPLYQLPCFKLSNRMAQDLV